MHRTLTELAERLAAVVEQVEAELGVALTDEELREDLPHVVQVFLHEACHAVLARRVPWVCDSSDPKLDLVNEVVVQVLEDELGTILGLPIHTPEEHARDSAALNPSVRVSPEQYRHIQRQWRETYGPGKDLAGMCQRTLAYLFPERGAPAGRF